MGTRLIQNKRVHDTNIQKNRVRVVEEQEFTLPSEVVRTIKDRDALVAALEVFCEVTSTGLKFKGRDREGDVELLPFAQRVLNRIR